MKSLWLAKLEEYGWWEGLRGLHNIVEMPSQGWGLDEGLAEASHSQVAQLCHKMTQERGDFMGKPLVSQLPVSANTCPVRWSCSSIKPTFLLLFMHQPHCHKLAGLPKQGQESACFQKKRLWWSTSRGSVQEGTSSCPFSTLGAGRVWWQMYPCVRSELRRASVVFELLQAFPSTQDSDMGAQLCLAFDLPHDQL